MKSDQILPTILIAIQLASAVVYGFNHDWRKVIYWLCASGLVAAVTY